MSKVINLANKFNLFQEPWHPKIVGELNELICQTSEAQRRVRLASSRE